MERRDIRTYKNRPLKINVKVDNKQLDDITDRLAKQAKVDSNKAGKNIVNELGKAGKGASKKLSKELEIEPDNLLGNRNRLVRRLKSDLERVLTKMEFNIGLAGFDDATARMALDRQEKRLKKMFSEITPELDTTDFLQKARRLEAELDFLTEEAVKLDPRKRYEQRLAEWLDAEKKFNRKRISEWLNAEQAWKRQVADSWKALDDAKIQNGAANKQALDKLTNDMKDFGAAVERAGAAHRKFNRLSWYEDAGTRQAFREYLYGFRDMGTAIDNLRRKASGGFLVGLEDPITRIASKTDRIRMRGGLAGALLGGAGALGTIKLAKNSVAGIGKAAATAGNQVNGMADRVAKLGKNLKPNFGTGINLGGYLVILAGVLALAAPLVGLLTTGLLAIPGLLATFIAPIGAIVLGFKGIKKAAENAGLFKDKNGDKKGGGSLGEALTELQKKTEDVFENTLTEPFKKFGALSQELIAPMETVAQGAADIMSGMVNSINDNIENGRIGETMEAIGNELSRSFAPGIESFSNALIGLAHEFTTGGALEGLGDWFRDTMADFENWVNTTDLTTEFEGLGAVLKDILDSLGQMASTGLEFMNDPVAVQNFRDNLNRIYDLLEGIVSLSGALQDAFKGLIPDFDPEKAWVEDITAPFTSKDAALARHVP